jgi:NTE family protein
VPITPTLRDLTDRTIAIDINAPAEPAAGEGTVTPDPKRIATDDVTFGSLASPTPSSPTPMLEAPPAQAPASSNGDASLLASYRQRIGEFLGGFMGSKETAIADPGILELFARSLDVVQETVTRFRLAAQPPDLVIPIPRNACAFYEFHRAEELIELGRERTRAALKEFHPANKR